MAFLFSRKGLGMRRIFRIAFLVTTVLIIIACSIPGCGTQNNIVTNPTPTVVSLAIQPQTQSFNAVGQTITYNYVVTNTGTSRLAGPVTISDNKMIVVTCPNLNTVGNKNDSLDNAESITCTGSYVTTQADINNGAITNTATATVGGQTSNQATATVKVQLTPVLSLTVSASPTTYTQANQNITFSYTITNTGPTPLGPAQFVVSDTRFPNPLNCGPNTTTLATGQSVPCQNVYTTTSTDASQSNSTSTATASGAGAGTAQPVTVVITNPTIPSYGTPAANITPGSMVTHVVTPGDWMLQISRCYGTSFSAVATANPQITDPNVIYPANIVRVPNVGSVGRIYGPPCMIWYTVVSGDSWQSIATKYNAAVDVLKAANPAVSNPTAGIKIKVPVNSAGGAPVTQAPPPPPVTLLTLSVSPNPNVYSAPGQNITFNYTIMNSGTSTLGPTQFIVMDNRFPTPINCGSNTTTLAPNQSVNCNAVYATTQADITAGQIVSSATASGAGAATSQPVVTTVRYSPQPTTPQPTRITFPNTNPATVPQSGTIGTPGTVSYVFSASAGQILSVQLTVSTNDVALGIYGPGNTTLKQPDNVNSWSGTLNATGDYFINLVSSVGAPSKPYTLVVSLNTPLTPATPGTPVTPVTPVTPAPSSGAVMVSDIMPGAGSSNPSYLSAFNSQLYFQATGNNNAGAELWKYDRGSNAVSFVYDIYPGVQGGEPAYLRPYAGNFLYLGADGNNGFGNELWRFNGSAVGMVNDVFKGPTGSFPKYLTEYNGLLYFSANGNNGAGVELWKFDGNTSQATMAADINQGPGDSNPSYLCVYNGVLYFAATTTNGGTELWKFDGTNATLAADIATGAPNSNPAYLAVYNNLLYFSADGNNNAGNELWKYDGTNQPALAADINPGSAPSGPTFLTVLNNILYFGALGNTNTGFELWKFDGTTASIAADINPGSGSSNPAYLAVYNNELYFQADGNNASGIELWRYKAP